MKNLTKPLEIRHALERKLGNGAVTIFAKQHDYSLAYISQTMSGDRSNETVLRLMANCLGCRVHGVFPEKNANILANNSSLTKGNQQHGRC